MKHVAGSSFPGLVFIPVVFALVALGDGVARSNTHIVPNLNDCKRCHQNESMEPLGPTARNLNRDVA